MQSLSLMAEGYAQLLEDAFLGGGETISRAPDAPPLTLDRLHEANEALKKIQAPEIRVSDHLPSDVPAVAFGRHLIINRKLAELPDSPPKGIFASELEREAVPEGKTLFCDVLGVWWLVTLPEEAPCSADHF